MSPAASAGARHVMCPKSVRRFFWSVCLYVWTWVRLYVCSYVRLYLCSIVCMRVCMHVFMYVRMCVCILCVCVKTFSYVGHIPLCDHEFSVYVYVYVCVFRKIYTYEHTRIHSAQVSLHPASAVAHYVWGAVRRSLCFWSVCLNVCMCVRMFVCTYVRIHVCTHLRIFVRSSACLYVCMHVFVYVRMCVCMYIYMYICVREKVRRCACRSYHSMWRWIPPSTFMCLETSIRMCMHVFIVFMYGFLLQAHQRIPCLA